MHAKSLQSCLTLWDPIDCSLQAVHEILQARILEWVAMPSSEDLPNPGIELVSLMSHAWQTGSLPLASPGKPGIGLCLTVFPEIRKQEGFEAAEARVG